MTYKWQLAPDYIDTPELHTQPVDITFPPGADKFIYLQCRGELLYSNMPEVAALNPFLENLNPKTVIEIGCGIGRGSVYLAKRYNWDNANFLLYDGDSGDETLFGSDRKGKNDFYNDIDMTTNYCQTNGMKKFEVINAEETSLLDIPYSFDLACSFLSIGFHWSIEFYLDDLAKKLNPGGICIFGTQGSDKVDGEQFTHRQIDAIDQNQWKILLNHRKPHMQRQSVLVLQKYDED